MNRRERRRALATSPAISQRFDHPEAARHYHEAVQYLKQDRLDESDIAHRRVLTLVPNHAPTLHHLGLIAFKRQNPDSAVEFIRRSVAVKPDYHEAWHNLAIILGEMSRSEEAIDACRQSLELQPDSAEIHTTLGNLLRVAENDADAMRAYAKALELEPDKAVALARLAELLLKSGDIDGATARCRRALEIEPDLQVARTLERRMAATSRSAEAIASEIEIRSKSGADLANSLDEAATYMRDERRYAEAADLCRRAVAADPGVATYRFNLALALEGLGQLDRALASYQAGLAVDPGRAEAYASVGVLLRAMNMHAGAIQALQHAVKLDPGLASAHYNLAITYKQRDEYEEARAAFQKCLECAPDAIVNRFEFVNLRRILCDWDGIDDEERFCLEAFRTKPVQIAPFQLIPLWASSADQLRAARCYVKTFDVPENQRFTTHSSGLGERQRIRLGFLSCDFFEHATAMLFAEVLEKLDRTRFEIFGYCYSPDDGSAMRERLLQNFEHLRIIGPITNRDTAELIRSDAIDILIDLKGYTKDARPEILAYRPAPIQVNYLGYPGTMGADFMDYILADAVVAPTAMQEHYPERIVHLPHSYQPNDRKRQISDDPVTRSEFGLPENAFVFCSFNNSYKLNAAMFDVWMPLLLKIPDSVLWLLVPNQTCANNLRREAKARGVDPDRLVFAQRMSIAKHLARHRVADLFLDALPCNAHTTTSDALWAGLPVLTCLGETFAGRVAGSLLTAMGLPELIMTSLADYSNLALELAQDKTKLAGIRQRLMAGRDSAPLFDTSRYTRNLERSFETMVAIARAGEAPRPFAVVEEDEQEERPNPRPTSLREIYRECPLCGGHDAVPETEARITTHPLHNAQLPPVLGWRCCSSCEHVFTEGYLTPAGVELLHGGRQQETTVGKDAENSRKVSAKTVSRVARYVSEGAWVDVGFGNASLLFTAAEWGFRPIGIDENSASVAKLKRFGYEAGCNLADLNAEASASVVSMMEGFDRIAFPREVLATIHRVLRPGGALVLSLPNRETIIWRALEATGKNTYWADIERHHSFTRRRLAALLEAHGFKFVEYDIVDDRRSAMEIVAVKTS